jgi:dTDP-4-dehydrorhamnose reductase
MLGCALVPALRAAGHDVVAHGHLRSADVRADLTDVDATAGLLDRLRPAVVVNLVALADVDVCEIEPQRADLLNVRVVENLAGAIGRNAAGAHLVHISTDQVYGGPGPHVEADVRAANAYASSKLAGESVAARIGATVLRTNFYGRSACARRPSFTDWLQQALTERRAIKVFEDVRFNPMAIDALVDVIALVVARRPAGVFNVGAAGGMSKADFAFAFAAAAGLPVDTVSRSTSDTMTTFKAYRPKDMRMDCRRLEQALGVTLPGLVDEIERIGRGYRAPA